jgi:prepilin-type N-terminal cleavage/methylation domain-containing protein
MPSPPTLVPHFRLQRRRRGGFTLLELIVAVILLGILTLIAVPTYNSVTSNARRTALITSIESFDRDYRMSMAITQARATTPTSPGSSWSNATVTQISATMPSLAVAYAGGTTVEISQQGSCYILTLANEPTLPLDGRIDNCQTPGAYTVWSDDFTSTSTRMFFAQPDPSPDIAKWVALTGWPQPAVHSLQTGRGRLYAPAESATYATFKQNNVLPANSEITLDIYMSDPTYSVTNDSPYSVFVDFRQNDAGSERFRIYLESWAQWADRQVMVLERFTGVSNEFGIDGITVAGVEYLTFAPGDVVHLKIRTDGPHFYAKAWVNGASEPSNWQIDYTETQLPFLTNNKVTIGLNNTTSCCSRPAESRYVEIDDLVIRSL